jgi:hypothetical protein
MVKMCLWAVKTGYLFSSILMDRHAGHDRGKSFIFQCIGDLRLDMEPAEPRDWLIAPARLFERGASASKIERVQFSLDLVGES